ncbi:hypothetical protein ACQJ0O_24230 [Pseudomonas shirazensis]|nr:hypothetical protein [Pseudomonas putida]MBO0369870.1 hypothetical protein [Pseudomonas putida]
MDYTLIPNPRSWSIVWQVVVVLGPLAIMIVGMFMSILIAWGRDLERMLGALQSSVWLDTQKRMWGNERLFSRWLLFGTISGILAMPGIHIKRGELDEQELDSFPRSLRQRVLTANAMMYGAALILLCVAGLYNLHKQ